MSFMIKINSSTHFASEEILNSKEMKEVISIYLSNLEVVDKENYYLIKRTFGENYAKEGILSFLKRTYNEPYDSFKEEYLPLTRESTTVLNMLDGMYDVWRKQERYGYIDRDEVNIPASSFVSLTDEFSDKVITLYRKIYENVLGSEQTVYRQLPSGINAAFILKNEKLVLPPELSFLEKTKFVQSILIRPPFIVSTKENTRTGTFFYNDEPLKEDNYISDDYLGVALLIKGHLGYVFIHKDYLSFLVALGNLFQVTRIEKHQGKKPDFVVVFGADISSDLTYYYKTKENVYVGLCPLKGHIEYFGYLKKIILTLHNMKMIDEGYLPIHGAGISITLLNGKQYNIAILGDSGAGKSETIEALKSLGSKDILQIRTIYDDMGTFEIRDGEVVTNGTETGAFVRLDDLEKGYSLKSVDRAIYMNIENVNSRVVIPIETYEETKLLRRVDAFLLADNFTPSKIGLMQFTSKEEAEKEFIKGERVAKGTTSEKGKVTSFFANPFGPVQRKDDCQKIIDKFFTKLYDEHIYLGKLYTMLSLDPVKGPEQGAKSLIEFIKNLDSENK